MTILNGLALVTSSAALSAILVEAIRRWALRHQLLDIPNPRSSHNAAIPRGGGLAIVGVSIFGLLTFVWLQVPGGMSEAVWFAAAAVLVSTVSLIDDFRPQPTWLRLISHCAAAAIVIRCLGAWTTVDRTGWAIHLGPAGVGLTALWIVGLINAYNFMDGIDGIAAGQALVAGAMWAYLGWRASSTSTAALGLLAASTSLGFLIHNWPPARIFMGDVGSSFLGYTFATLPLMFEPDRTELFLAGLMAVWPFVLDTTFTFLRRLSRRENVFQAHRSHLYQRLVISGVSHKQVTILYISLAGIGAVLAIGVVEGVSAAIAVYPIVIASAFLCLWLLVIYCESRMAVRT